MNSVEMTGTHTSSDLTIWGLFFAADPFGKLVMLPLGLGAFLGLGVGV